MNMMLVLAGANGAIGVAALAAGAHALKAKLPPSQLDQFLLAAQIQLWHAIALLALGGVLALAEATAPFAGRATMAGWTLQAGIILFSGSLYWLSLNGPGSLGPFHWLTPIGGLLLMAGWIFILFAGLKATGG